MCTIINRPGSCSFSENTHLLNLLKKIKKERTNGKQVAQRATIAHLTASHQNILKSSQVKDFLNWSRAANSEVHCWIRPYFKLVRDYIVGLFTCNNEEDPIKNEGARVLTSLMLDFSDAQGQLTPKSVVKFRRNSNSSKLL